MVAGDVFWNRAAKRYSEQPIKNMDAYEQTMDRTRSHLRPDDQVLEVGCGTGSTALLLAKHVGHITGSDFSSAMVDIARQKGRDQKIDNVDFVRSPADGVQKPDGSYDAVLAFNLVHLIRDRQEAIRQVRRLLKPGGLFISKTPCLASRRWLLGLPIMAMQLFGRAPYVAFLNVAELDRLVESEGFTIIETGAYPASVPSRFIVARKD